MKTAFSGSLLGALIFSTVAAALSASPAPAPTVPSERPPGSPPPAAVPPAPAQFSVPAVTARLDRTELAVGERAELTVEVSWPGAAAGLIFEPPAPPDCHLLAVERSAQESLAELSPSGPRQVLRYRFRLRAREKGEGRVGYVAIAYRRPGEEESHTLKSDPLDVAVVSSRSALKTVFPAAAVLLLAAAVAVALRRRALGRRVRSAPPALRNEEGWRAEALATLSRAKKLAVEGEPAATARALFEALSLLLARRHGVEIARDGWPERVMALGLPEGTRKELVEIVRTVEQARFGSRLPAGAENDALIKRIHSLVERDG